MKAFQYRLICNIAKKKMKMVGLKLIFSLIP